MVNGAAAFGRKRLGTDQLLAAPGNVGSEAAWPRRKGLIETHTQELAVPTRKQLNFFPCAVPQDIGPLVTANLLTEDQVDGLRVVHRDLRLVPSFPGAFSAGNVIAKFLWFKLTFTET